MTYIDNTPCYTDYDLKQLYIQKEQHSLASVFTVGNLLFAKEY